VLGMCQGRIPPSSLSQHESNKPLPRSKYLYLLAKQPARAAHHLNDCPLSASRILCQELLLQDIHHGGIIGSSLSLGIF
jgi:hypothetical protein